LNYLIVMISFISQMMQELEGFSGSPTDLYPILSHAILSAISEGITLDQLDEALFHIIYSRVGPFGGGFG
jgi:hypothetical protein